MGVGNFPFPKLEWDSFMGKVGKFELGFKWTLGVQSLAVVAGGFAVDIGCFEVL